MGRAPVELGLAGKDETMAKLAWRVKLNAELEQGTASEPGNLRSGRGLRANGKDPDYIAHASR